MMILSLDIFCDCFLLKIVINVCYHDLPFSISLFRFVLKLLGTVIPYWTKNLMAGVDVSYTVH